MVDDKEIARVVGLLQAQLGKPYAEGGPDPKTGQWIVRGKPSFNDPNPKEFDCSGLAKWVIAQLQIDGGGRILVPDGCVNMIRVCKALGMQTACPLDLGFADLHAAGGAPDHVIVVEDEDNVIEARGAQPGKDYNKVIRRPRSVWEAQKGFLGWFRVPGIYDNDPLVFRS